jgi:maltose alpha-D-glucosyltransferase / alpha-amylase
VIAWIDWDGEEALMYDGVFDNGVQEELFGLIRKRSKLKGLHGEMEGSSGRRLQKLKDEELPLKSHVVASKPSNTSVTLGDKYFFKIYRSPQEGDNPDVEILKNLTRHTSFENLPPYVGRLDYRGPGIENTSMALLVDLIPNVGNAWEWTQTAIEDFFDKLLSHKESDGKFRPDAEGEMDEMIGPFFLEMIALMGQRTAQMHEAMASVKEVKGFEPEAFSLLYQKSVYQSLRTFVKRTFSAVVSGKESLEPELRQQLETVISKQDEYLAGMQEILEQGKIKAKKTRIHGNYKLDKLLFTGKDFIVTDFEGEVEFPLSVRKIKHSPLKDVASMLSSLHYAVYKGYFHRKEFVPVDENYLRPMLELWYQRVFDVFVDGYTREARKAGIIPDDQRQVYQLLHMYVFEKAVRELRNFMERDPASLIIPLKALENIRCELEKL